MTSFTFETFLAGDFARDLADSMLESNGFQPIGTNVFNQLWNAAVELGGFTEAELPTFPRLAEPRAASA